nr:MAG TPA: hypothetical protein [Caudoviricetes sp.]
MPLRDQDTGGKELSLFETYITKKFFRKPGRLLLCYYYIYYYYIYYKNKIPGARKYKLKFNLRIKFFKGSGRRYGMCLILYSIVNKTITNKPNRPFKLSLFETYITKKSFVADSKFNFFYYIYTIYNKNKN